MINIIPKNRDKQAKKLYQYLQWHFRADKKRMELFVKSTFEDYIIHGKGCKAIKYERCKK